MVDNQCGKKGTRSSKVVAWCGPLHASSLQVAYWNFVVYEDKIVNGTFSFVQPERLVCLLFFCHVGTFLRAPVVEKKRQRLSWWSRRVSERTETRFCCAAVRSSLRRLWCWKDDHTSEIMRCRCREDRGAFRDVPQVLLYLLGPAVLGE